MAIVKGDYQSVMAAGWWINVSAGECDYPDADDVRKGIEFDYGGQVGTMQPGPANISGTVTGGEITGTVE
jgi:hypothetical protein